MAKLGIERFMQMKKHSTKDQHMTLLMHILSNVAHVNGCWEWQGSTQRRDYGNIRIDNKLYTVTRLVAWLAFQFAIENSSVFVCHTCDNPKCINPEHLFLGSAQDNATDMMAKFRQKGRRPKPNDKDLIFIEALEGGDETKVAGDRVGYSPSYARTITSILIPYWKTTGVYPIRKEK